MRVKNKNKNKSSKLDITMKSEVRSHVMIWVWKNHYKCCNIEGVDWNWIEEKEIGVLFFTMIMTWLTCSKILTRVQQPQKITRSILWTYSPFHLDLRTCFRVVKGLTMIELRVLIIVKLPMMRIARKATKLRNEEIKGSPRHRI